MPSSSSSSSVSSSSSLSHVSHTTSSSSLSSPSSSSSSSSPSPESSSQNHRPSPYLSKVPFVWEETPGVLKKDHRQIMTGEQFELVQEASSGEGSFLRLPRGYGAVAVESTLPLLRLDGSSNNNKKLMQQARELNVQYSSKKHGGSKVLAGESLPSLRPPPCLTQPEHAHFPGNEDARRQGAGRHRLGASRQVSATISSLSFNKRGHQRTPSLEDDPFWVAMVACTNETTGNGGWRRKNSSKVMEESGNSCLPKSRRPGDIYGLHFEQCLPGHSMPRSAIIRLEKALSTVSIKDDDHDRNVVRKHAMADDALHDMIGDSLAAARKALKALSSAKAGLHDRCKLLLRQQSAPPDISDTYNCDSSKKMKKKLPIYTPKHKFPDLFGCKSMDLPVSNRPLNLSPQ